MDITIHIVWRHGAQVRLLGQHYQEWDAASDVHCILLKGAGPKVGVPVNSYRKA